MLRSSKQLELILQAPDVEVKRVDTIVGLPSWAPDYFQATNWTSRYLMQEFNNHSQLDINPEFSIIDGKAPNLSILRLKARFLGKVEMKGGPMPQLIPKDHAGEIFLRVSTFRIAPWAALITKKYGWNYE
jgi:hypothetical protein